MDKIVYFSEFMFDSNNIDIKTEIFESSETGRKMSKVIVEGIYQSAEVVNGNGRVYPEHILRRETDKCNSIIRTSGALIGEMEHPKRMAGESQDDYIKRAVMPNPERAAGVHLSLAFNNKHVYGKSTILSEDGSHGQKLANLLKAGYKIGISSRAVGGKPETSGGNVIIPESISFVTWDFVTNASNPASRQLTTIINESLSLHSGNEYEYWENINRQEKFNRPKGTSKNIWQVLEKFI